MGVNIGRSYENAGGEHGGPYCGPYSSGRLANQVLGRAERALQFYIIGSQNGLLVVLIFMVEYVVIFGGVVGWDQTNVRVSY